MKKSSLVYIFFLVIALSGCKASLPDEGKQAVKEYWENLQSGSPSLFKKVYKPEDQKGFNIASIEEGKDPNGPTLGVDEVWCGNFSSAMILQDPYSNLDFGKICTKDTPCEDSKIFKEWMGNTSLLFYPVIKNFIVVREGNLWEVFQLFGYENVHATEDAFLSYGCKNWEKEYDLSDHDVFNKVMNQ